MEIQVCRNCGFGEVCSPIDHEQLSRFYDLEYRCPQSHVAIDYRKHYPMPSSRDLSQYVDTRRSSLARFDTFLDVGPGYGGALKLVSILNPACPIYALEANPGAASCFRRVIPNFTSIENIEELQSISVVFMSQVLEHLTCADSLSLLAALRRRLTGALMIEVPHVDFRRYVHAQDAPHLQFFSEQSLQELIRRSGYKIAYSTQIGEALTKGDGLAERLSRQRSPDDHAENFGRPGFASRSVQAFKNMAANLGFSSILDVVNVYRLARKYAKEVAAENRRESDCLRVIAEPV